MSLGTRLRQFINLNGMTVRELEKRSGIPYRSLHEYLSDKRKPGADHLVKLIGAGVDVEWLLTGALRPGMYFNFESVKGLNAVKGALLGDAELVNILLHDAVNVVDEIIAENPDAKAVMGIEGIISSVWSVFQLYVSLVESHEEHFVKARETGYPVDKVAAMLLEPVRGPVKSKLRKQASEMPHKEV